jgi:hypothetical protein
MEELGPLTLMYSWQALLCASGSAGATRLLKTTLNLTIGREQRKATPWLQTLALPVFPVLAGAVYAVVVPLRPEALVSYASAHLDDGTSWVGFAAWGAACGQFSTMLHQKLRDFVRSETVPKS